MSNMQVTITPLADGRHEWKVEVDGWGDTSGVVATYDDAIEGAGDWILRFNESQVAREASVTVEASVAVAAAEKAQAAQAAVAADAEVVAE